MEKWNMTLIKYPHPHPTSFLASISCTRLLVSNSSISTFLTFEFLFIFIFTFIILCFVFLFVILSVYVFNPVSVLLQFFSTFHSHFSYHNFLSCFCFCCSCISMFVLFLLLRFLLFSVQIQRVVGNCSNHENQSWFPEPCVGPRSNSFLLFLQRQVLRVKRISFRRGSPLTWFENHDLFT